MEGVGEAGGGCLSVAQGAGPPALPRIEYGTLNVTAELCNNRG
jgi:hypothetical protein